MFTVILRSVCVGIAATVLGAVCSIFIEVGIAMHHAVKAPSDGPEVGWEIVVLPRERPALSFGVPLVAFVIGFAVGFRYFFKARTNETAAR